MFKLPTNMHYLTYERALEELILLDLLNYITVKSTDIGHRASTYPLPAHLARTLLGCFGPNASSTKQCQSEVLTLASILSFENAEIFQQTKDERALELQRGVTAHYRNEIDDSDHLTLVNLFVA